MISTFSNCSSKSISVYFRSNRLYVTTPDGDEVNFGEEETKTIVDFFKNYFLPEVSDKHIEELNETFPLSAEGERK